MVHWFHDWTLGGHCGDDFPYILEVLSDLLPGKDTALQDSV